MTTVTSNLETRYLPPTDDIRLQEIDRLEEEPASESAGLPIPTTEEMPAPRLGVGSAITNSMNRLVVTAYKFAGFIVLSVILFGLGSYIALNALFFLHSRWVAPAIIAPSDPRVLELRARLAHETWNRKKVDSDRATIQAGLERARRTVELEEKYQSTFFDAVAQNASFKKGKLVKAKSLRRELAYIQQRLKVATDRYTKVQGEALSEATEARLIDRDRRVKGEFHIAELGAKQVTLRGQKAALISEIFDISQELQALNTVARDPTGSAPATVEGLQLKRNFMNSVLAEKNARDEVTALEASAEAFAEASQVYEDVISIIRESPLLLAASGELTVAFLPYTNVGGVREGDSVYACAAYVVWCRKVGKVGRAIQGEIVSKHPLYRHEIRGKFVRLDLSDPSAATKVVLHVGRAPLFL